MFNLSEIITTVESALKNVQAGIDAEEHIVSTVKGGDISVPQIVNAAGALNTALTNLKNHEAAVEQVLKANGGPAPIPPPATPAVPAAAAPAPAPTGEQSAEVSAAEETGEKK